MLHDKTAVTLDITQKNHLTTVIDYISGIHHHIDPEYFEIDLAALKSLGEKIETENPVLFDFNNQFLLETAITAAEAYSARKGYDPVPGMETSDFEELMRLMVDIHGTLREKAEGVMQAK